MAADPEVIWRPTERQTAALASSCPDLFFGGARGGGKSDFLIFDWFAGAERSAVPFNGILFRKSLPQLQEIIARCHHYLPRLGGTWSAQEKTWKVKKSYLRMRYLESTADAEQYQGHEFQWVGCDEAGTYSKPDVLDLMWGCLRTKHKDQGVYLRLTGNPGGPGHQWLKDRYVVPGPPGEAHRDAQGQWRQFIPSLLQDNPHIQDQEAYKERLKKVGRSHIVAAWLNGSWDIVPEGGILNPDLITEGRPPDHARTYVTIDPAVSPLPSADDTSVVVTSVWKDAKVTKWCHQFGDAWKADTDESADRIFAICEQYNPLRVILEGGPCGRGMEPPLRRRFRESGKHYNLELITHGGGDKVAKAAPMQAAISGGCASAIRGTWWQKFSEQFASFTGEEGMSDGYVDAAGIIYRMPDINGVEAPVPPPKETTIERVEKLVNRKYQEKEPQRFRAIVAP